MNPPVNEIDSLPACVAEDSKPPALSAACVMPPPVRPRESVLDVKLRIEVSVGPAGLQVKLLDKLFTPIQVPGGLLLHPPAIPDAQSIPLEGAAEVALKVISRGCIGVGRDVLSSSALSKQIASELAGVPRAKALHRMLVRLGFVRCPKLIKWRGCTHTVWMRPGFSGDLRWALDQTIKNSHAGSWF